MQALGPPPSQQTAFHRSHNAWQRPFVPPYYFQNNSCDVLCQPWLLGKLEDWMNGCQFHALLDVKLQVSVVNNVFFFFPEIWNKFGLFTEFYAEFFYEVQCIFREVLLLHRTLFHCEWIVVVIFMQMCRVRDTQFRHAIRRGSGQKFYFRDSETGHFYSVSRS